MAIKIMVIHGPNLNLLGKREPDIYGKVTLDEINRSLRRLARKEDVELMIIQSNHEGEIVDCIGKSAKKFSALVINPAGYTHTSVAIRDAILAVGLPVVEVHVSNIHAREEFRKTSLISPVTAGQVTGFGLDSYLLGLRAAVRLARKKKPASR